MPCWTEVTIRSKDLESVKAMLRGKGILGDEREVTFNAVIPMPDDVHRGEISLRERELKPNNWWDWSIKNWGTKWDACDVKVDNEKVEFSCAWCVPEPVIDAIGSKVDIKVVAKSECDNKLRVIGYKDGRRI